MRERRSLRGNTLHEQAQRSSTYPAASQTRERQAAWLDFICGTSQMSAALMHDSRLIEREQRCYINRHMEPARRYAVITDHYRMTISTFPADIFKAIYQDGRHLIGTLRLKDGSSLAIDMRRPAGRRVMPVLGRYARSDAVFDDFQSDPRRTRTAAPLHARLGGRPSVVRPYAT